MHPHSPYFDNHCRMVLSLSLSLSVLLSLILSLPRVINIVLWRQQALFSKALPVVTLFTRHIIIIIITVMTRCFCESLLKNLNLKTTHTHAPNTEAEVSHIFMTENSSVEHTENRKKGNK